MNFGMIGAIGGAGAGLQQQGAFLQKQEEADLETNRQKGFQDWLMKKREEYAVAAEGRAENTAIRTEGRTDKRSEEKADRDFSRAQREAPVRRDIKVADDQATARGKSAVARETLDSDAEVTRRLAEAKETPSEKALREATADSHTATAEYTRGAKTALAATAGGGKMTGVDKDQLDNLQKQAEYLQKRIDTRRDGGNWLAKPPAADDEAGQAQWKEQRGMESQLAALSLQQQQLVARYSPGQGADPLGKRGAPGAGGGKPADADRTAILQAEYRKAAQAASTLTDPEQRKRAELDRDSVREEMRRLGIRAEEAPAAPVATPVSAPAAMVGGAAAPAAAAPPAPPAAPAVAPAQAEPGTAKAALQELTGDPLEELGQRVDSTRRELRDAAAKPPGLAAGGPAREQYQQKVAALRERLRTLEKQYQVGVSVAPGLSTTAARTYAKP